MLAHYIGAKCSIVHVAFRNSRVIRSVKGFSYLRRDQHFVWLASCCKEPSRHLWLEACLPKCVSLRKTQTRYQRMCLRVPNRPQEVLCIDDAF
jgi:hypothetical protein